MTEDSRSVSMVGKFWRFCVGSGVDCLAGLLLLIFGVSDFLMLQVYDSSQSTINTVFLFFTNWDVHLLAAIFACATAFICFIFRGQTFASLATLTFIVVMLWYHWALALTGGGQACGCLGVLGKALHFSKSQEKVIPFEALGMLSLTLVPALVRQVRRMTRSSYARRHSNASRSILTVIPFMLFPCCCLLGQQTIQLGGECDSYYYYCKPNHGEPVTNLITRAKFTCIISGNAWGIFMTNGDTNPDSEGMRTPWENIVYDGTNIYTVMPYHAEAQGRNWTIESPEGAGCKERVTEQAGPIFVRDYDEWLCSYAVWLTYGLCPTNIPASYITNGSVDLPCPWENARNKSLASCFSWQITPSADGRFASSWRAVFEPSLVESVREQILQGKLNPPPAMGLYNHLEELRRMAPGVYRKGFVTATYVCTRWFHTNGIAFPAASYLRVFFSYADSTNRYEFDQISLTNVTVREGLETMVPSTQGRRLVADYRYRRVRGEKILPDLVYVLTPGKSWMADNDPGLNRRADASVARAVDLSDIGGAKFMSFLVLAILVLTLAPLIFYSWKSRTKNINATLKGKENK